MFDNCHSVIQTESFNMPDVCRILQLAVVYLLSLEASEVTSTPDVIPSNAVVRHGEDFVLTCSSNCNTCSIRWYNSDMCGVSWSTACPPNNVIYNGYRVSVLYPRFNVTSVTNTTSHSSKLLISNVQLIDAGSYVCEEANNVAQISQRDIAQLVVFDDLPDCSANTSLSLSTDIVSLTCIIMYNGNQTCSLAFVDDYGQRITSGGISMNAVSNSTRTTLQYVLNTVTTAVSSTRCVATFGSSSSIVSGRCPHVSEKPHNVRIFDIKQHYSVNEQIQCAADGIPLPSYEWKELSSDNISNGSVLTISSWMPGQNFTFQCIAMNVVNGQVYTTSLSISFQVQGYDTLTTTSVKSGTDLFTCATERDRNNVAKNAAIAVGVIAIVSIAFNVLQLIYIMRLRTRSLSKTSRDCSDRAKDGTTVDESQMYADLSPSTRDTVQSAPYEPLDFQHNRTYANVQEK